ncbi:MAG: hypothetical protein WBL47_03650 [Bacilli bacterium]|jgi:hypothetical protein|nr:hypothetical protein [Bacillota bacterium]NLM31140.1 hypothetical protein [Acholeplasmataceae bacterium]HOA78498.1 hypothetical protein [Bacilli bacterium]HPZ27450.1 hypothetical protein [Bacilli bacterium]HQC89846.1 hypothetical protein [Bacilli bacterium]
MKKDINIKLSLYRDRRVVIENYDKLLDLTAEMIKVDIYTIIGKFLKLTKMDGYMIEVVGEVGEIIIGE